MAIKDRDPIHEKLVILIIGLCLEDEKRARTDLSARKILLRPWCVETVQARADFADSAVFSVRVQLLQKWSKGGTKARKAG